MKRGWRSLPVLATITLISLTTVLAVESQAKKGKKGKKKAKKTFVCPEGWTTTSAGFCHRINAIYKKSYPPEDRPVMMVGEFLAQKKSYSVVQLKVSVFDEEGTARAAETVFLSNVYKDERVPWGLNLDVNRSKVSSYKVKVENSLAMTTAKSTIPEYTCPAGYSKASPGFCWDAGSGVSSSYFSWMDAYPYGFQGLVIPMFDSYSTLQMAVTVYKDGKAMGIETFFLSNAIKGEKINWDAQVDGHSPAGLNSKTTVGVRFVDGITLEP